MNPERWQQVKRIAGDALDVAAHEREAFVAAACSGDADLHAEVASLLAAEDPTGRFLEPDRPPARIGVYRITREIGRGGMGTVYEAERDDGQFEQRVAIKVVTRGMDSRAVARRFFAERQILAQLQHPNVARLFDGGITDDGRPYFVMELLDAAEPITTYARRRGLSIAERLDLFTIVCDAVEHAHSRLVLHRDLKPANILVDSTGTPKLLDFGIAKVLDPNADAASTVTQPGERAMTPQFGSPEQIRGDPLTTASDVYALGLLLYELLAGRLPYDVSSLPPAEQSRLICEEAPPRPSRVAPPADQRRLRGDLDNILLKALEKDPGRRYGRAADLAGDIRRFRRNLPVLARPAGAWYHAAKYASRHWRGLTVAAMALAAIVAALAEALQQGRRAERHFEQVRRVANSFLFEFHDAIAKLPGATPARELVLTRAVEYLDGLSRDAAGDVQLKRELAESYLRVGEAQGLYFESNLGKPAAARASFEKSAALFAEVAAARPSDMRAQVDLANARLWLSSTFQADEPGRALQLTQLVIERLSPPAESGTLDSAGRLALARAYFGRAESHVRTNHAAESLEARNRSIEILRTLAAADPGFPDGRRWLSQSLKRRAALYVSALGQPAKARQDLGEAMSIDTQRVERDPANAVAKLDLALGQSIMSAMVRRSGDLAASLDFLERAVAIRRAVLAADPQNVLVRVQLLGDHAKLAAIHRERHEPEAARAAVDAGLALAAAVTGPTHENRDFQQALADLNATSRTVASR